MSKRIPFSLSCTDCDAGMGFVGKREAQEAGWIGIHRDVTGPSWSDLGTCPDCQLHAVHTDLESLARSAWWVVNPEEKQCQKRWPKLVAENTDAAEMLKRLQELGKDLAVAEANLEKQRQWNAKHQEAVA